MAAKRKIAKAILDSHTNCIPKGKVEPGYVYRKKMIYFAFMDPVTEAEELKKIMDVGNYSGKDMESLGYGDEQTVLMKVSILKLPEKIQKWLKDGRLKPTIGYTIYAVKNDALRIALAKRAITERLSIRAVKYIMEDMKKRGIFENRRKYKEPAFCPKCNRRLRRNEYLKGVPLHICDSLHLNQRMVMK